MTSYAKHIKEKRLASGARILVAPFSSHRHVSLAGSILGGTLFAGSGELAKVHAAMLLEGTIKRHKKELQIALDAIGASLLFSAGSDRLYFSGHVRITHLEEFLTLIAEALSEPAFPARELKILKSRERAALALEAQDTHVQAEINLTKLLFKRGHPNFTEETAASLQNLEKLDVKTLRALHEKILDGSSLILSASGDIVPMRLFSLTEKVFRKLSTQDLSLPHFTKATPGFARRVAMPIKEKASIDYELGIATGIGNKHPDYAPLLLGIQIFGVPGFSGRLMSTVREVEGLTYAAYSYLSGFRHTTDGYIRIWSSFAPGLFSKGRTAILREIQKIAREGVTAEEVRRHRERFEASFRVRLSSSGAFARAAHDCIADNKPLSYLDTFPERILTLSAPEVNRALRKYLIPSKLSESAAGSVTKNFLPLNAEPSLGKKKGRRASRRP